MKKGFTIVEVLVVVSIIGILIALLLPAIFATRDMVNKKQVQQAAEVQVKIEKNPNIELDFGKWAELDRWLYVMRVKINGKAYLLFYKPTSDGGVTVVKEE